MICAVQAASISTQSHQANHIYAPSQSIPALEKPTYPYKAHGSHSGEVPDQVYECLSAACLRGMGRDCGKGEEKDSDRVQSRHAVASHVHCALFWVVGKFCAETDKRASKFEKAIRCEETVSCRRS